MARIEIPEWARFQVGLTSHQIIEIDGVLRYKESPLMSWLCNRINLCDMRIAYEHGDFPLGEYMQFYRDVGYSLNGFEEVFGDVLEAMEAEPRTTIPDSESLLTPEAYLAVIVRAIRNQGRGDWFWLCLNDEAREEQIAEARVKHEEWRARELEAERMRGGDAETKTRAGARAH